MEQLTDAELDAYIRTRLRAAGVDISVLPEDDADAPADQARILASARRFLRSAVPTISEYTIEPRETVPVLYPAPHTATTGSRTDRRD